MKNKKLNQKKKRSILAKKRPEKNLVSPLKKKGGRGADGKISVRHRGGGEKRKYRKVNFGQEKMGINAVVEAIEYDPNRSAFIILLLYEDGEKRYRLAPEGIKVGSKVVCDEKTPQNIGNRSRLANILSGSTIFNIELFVGKGGKIVRGAGVSAQILSKEEGYAVVSLPSKETRMIKDQCFATIGQVSNSDHRTEILGKAGKSRHRGRRPTVRGSAMNPCDHPHGGGEGKSPIGLKHPKTPWGKPALGKKTRKKHKFSNRFILKRRK